MKRLPTESSAGNAPDTAFDTLSGLHDVSWQSPAARADDVCAVTGDVRDGAGQITHPGLDSVPADGNGVLAADDAFSPLTSAPASALAEFWRTPGRFPSQRLAMTPASTLTTSRRRKCSKGSSATSNPTPVSI